MTEIINETNRIEYLKVIESQSFGYDKCAYYLVDRCGRLQYTTVKIFINESFDCTIVSYEPK